MVYRVVSTKLTEEEHEKLLDVCNKDGCTPSALLKKTITNKINDESESEKDESGSRELTSEELRKALGIKPKVLGISENVEEKSEEHKNHEVITTEKQLFDKLNCDCGSNNCMFCNTRKKTEKIGYDKGLVHGTASGIILSEKGMIWKV